jgi:hypothetical protein
MLPLELFQSLPLDSLLVDQWALDFQALETDPVTATGSLHYEEQLTLRFTTSVLQADLNGQLVPARGGEL